MGSVFRARPTGGPQARTSREESHMYLLWTKSRGLRNDASVSWRIVKRAKSIGRLQRRLFVGDDLKYITRNGVQIWRNW